MIKVTLVDIEVSSDKEHAEVILPYGNKGYTSAFEVEDLECVIILTTSSRSSSGEHFYEEDFFEAAEILNNMKKGEEKEFILENGDKVLLVKED